jgi:hypothetical protein
MAESNSMKIEQVVTVGFTLRRFPCATAALSTWELTLALEQCGGGCLGPA